ncbi:MAG: hypothetical protein V7636_1144 [Actinomycetota bacterium]
MSGVFSEDPSDALVEVIDQMHAVGNASTAMLLAALVVIDQRDAYLVDGARDTATWLQLRHGMTAANATRHVRVARGLVFCPTLFAALQAGRLSFDQLVPCVDLVAYGWSDEATVAADAVGRTAWDLKRLAREAKKVSLAEAKERQQRKYLRMRPDTDLGGSWIDGFLPDVEAKIVETELRRGAETQPEDPEDGRRYLGERMADALVDLCSAGLADDADPDRATVVVHVDAHALAGDNHSLDLASLELGSVISMATVHRLACDGRCQVVVDDLFGKTVEVAKTIHTPPRWLRRRVIHRDGCCRWFGCERTALLHVHHIRWWTRDGGPTEESNLVALCPFHHRLVHEGGWEIEGDPVGRLTLTRPNGTKLTAGPPPLRDDIADELGLRWSTDPPDQAA